MYQVLQRKNAANDDDAISRFTTNSVDILVCCDAMAARV